jgi:membrane-bound serine protease (ClpP class)
MIDVWAFWKRLLQGPGGWLRWALLLWLLTMPLPAGADAASDASPRIAAVRVAGTINPVVAGFVEDELSRANRNGANAFLLELDTPGGLDTAMRRIVQGLLASRIPVVVYVYPPGARAASAGALITLAADIAVMAPGTNLGAAHPVAIGASREKGEGDDSVMMSKVVEDAAAYARSLARQRGRNEEWAEKMVRESISVSAEEALAGKVVDLIVENEDDLLKALDGRVYRRGEETMTLHTRGGQLVFSQMNWRERILDAVSDPNVAYMLLVLGLVGLFFEISQPGVILPGAVGTIALLLALFAFQTLPVNYVGVLFILLAVVLFILEVKIASYGMLSVGGIVSMTLGSLMLVEHSEPFMRISLLVIAATVAFFSGFFLLVLYMVTRTQRRPFVSGREGLAGERGDAVTDVFEDGRVFVHGEYWRAFAAERVGRGEKIEVVRMADDMRLEVRRIASGRSLEPSASASPKEVDE